MRLTQILMSAALFAILAFPAAANEYADAITKHAESVKSWLSDDAVQGTWKAQNDEYAGEHDRSLFVLDKKWKKEFKNEPDPIISAVMDNDLSAFLKQKKEGSQGIYAEIIVLNERGLGAGMSDVTEDYRYGRDDIWTLTFRKGTKSILIGDVEKDDSSGNLQSRLSLPVPHASGKYNVGSISIRLNVEKLAK
tara:strand:+ start:7464 stop:8042 length:579 start_codon:yes stop_codon:yes gene_type:complete